MAWGIGGVRFDVARGVDAPKYTELFLVVSVASLLTVRVYLEVAGFPRIGAGGLHIAHMLWGGLLLVAAVLMLVGFLGRQIKTLAAVVGGMGFGVFIDELGKFITSDNDYFFQPTVGLIYIVFIALYFVSQEIWGRGKLSEQELLVNAADLVREMILGGARRSEIAEALSLLRRSGVRDELTDALRRLVLTAPRVEPKRASLPARIEIAARHGYERLLAWPWFQRAVVLVFVGNAAWAVALALGNVHRMPADATVSPTALGTVVTSALAALMTLVGVGHLPRSRPGAYRWFKRSVLVSIFFVQVFAFFASQFAALGGLLVDVVLLTGLNSMLRTESLRAEDGVPPRRARDEVSVVQTR